MIVNHKYDINILQSSYFDSVFILYIFFALIRFLLLLHLFSFLCSSCTWRLEDRYIRNINNMSLIYLENLMCLICERKTYIHTQAIEYETLIFELLTFWVKQHTYHSLPYIIFLYLVSVKHQCTPNLCHPLDIFYLFILFLFLSNGSELCVVSNECLLKICSK